MTEIPPCLSARFEQSFAYITIKDRLPIIVTKIIDHLHREKDNIGACYGKEGQEETKTIIGYLAKLKNEMQTDKKVVPLVVNGTDVQIWNDYLISETLLGEHPTWFTAAWLYVECYMYRRIYEAFQLCNTLKYFDPFRSQKETAFVASTGAIEILGSHLMAVLKSSPLSAEEIQECFSKFIQISLWGNKCDLSISQGNDNSQRENPLEALKVLHQNILIDDTIAIWNALQLARQQEKVLVDIVLDNAGFELFSDLCLAEFLTSTNLVHCIRFYVKSQPWFVSDTTLDDFVWTLETLKHLFGNNSDMAALADIWQKRFQDKVWKIETETFWTLPHDYNKMKQVDHGLYLKLSEAKLVIFKGDLNYRKLTGDRNWNPSAPFECALRGFNPSPLCVLRTLKADTIVGLQVAQVEELQKHHQNWMISGEFAVIQYSDKKDTTDIFEK